MAFIVTFISILTFLKISLTVSASMEADQMKMMMSMTPPGLNAEMQCIYQEAIMCISTRLEILPDVMTLMTDVNKTIPDMDKFCSPSYQQLVAELFVCLEKKIVECYFKTNFSVITLPSKEIWIDGLQFMCEHKNELLQGGCTQTTFQEYTKCFVDMQQITLNVTYNSLQEVQSVMCSTMNKMKSCFQSSSSFNSCNGKLWIEMFEKFFPTSLCPAPSSNTSFMLSSSFASWWNLSLIILLAVHPLA